MNNRYKRRVIVTQNFFDEATISFLNSNDCEVVIVDAPASGADRDLSEDRLKSILQNADGWIVGHARVTRSLLSELPKLKVISRRGVGYDRIDLGAVRELGRVAAIAVGGNHASVADHTLALMLAICRRVSESHNRMIEGSWQILPGIDLNHKVVGIIGLGRIGREVVKRLKGFDTEIIISTPHPDKEFSAAHDISYRDLRDVLSQSDIVTLHAPLTPQTRFMIRAETLSTMKQGAIIVNAARGGLVEDRDLLEVLRSGRLSGAGFDVFASEIDPSYNEVTKELLSLPNVIATPHAAASSIDALNLCNRIAAENVIAVLDGLPLGRGRCIADGRQR